MCRLYGSRQSQPCATSQPPAPKIQAAPSATWKAPNSAGQPSNAAIVSHNAASQQQPAHETGHDSDVRNGSMTRIAAIKDVANKLAICRGMRKNSCSQSMEVNRSDRLAIKQMVACVSKVQRSRCGDVTSAP